MSIQFNASTPGLRNLLERTGFSYCGDVAFPEGCARICCLELADIVTEQGNNRLTPLDCLQDRKGVYIVAHGDTALYVGSSTKVSGAWNLRERIAQHFREKDSGGTLRKNWESVHPDCDFTQFLAAMRCCHLQVISFGRDACDQQVLRLEHLLIGLLGPRYCDVSRSAPRPETP